MVELASISESSGTGFVKSETNSHQSEPAVKKSELLYQNYYRLGMISFTLCIAR